MTRVLPLTVVVTTLAVLGITGCQQDDPILGPPPFQCTPQTCPDGACKLHLDFHEDCIGQVVDAEILMNGALEPQTATYGSAFISVGETPANSEAEFWIRAARWQWGPITYQSDDPDTDGRFKLSCTSANPEAAPEDGRRDGGAEEQPPADAE